MSTSAIIEIQDLTKTFKNASEAAVKGISFSINRNEIFGLLGPNGAGKTTTLSMLCGLYPPTSGNIIIDGKNFHQHILAIKKMIGIVPQDIALYPTLTARENLDFYGRMYGLKGNNLKEKREEWLQKLGLADAYHRLRFKRVFVEKMQRSRQSIYPQTSHRFARRALPLEDQC